MGQSSATNQHRSHMVLVTRSPSGVQLQVIIDQSGLQNGPKFGLGWRTEHN